MGGARDERGAETFVDYMHRVQRTWLCCMSASMYRIFTLQIYKRWF